MLPKEIFYRVANTETNQGLWYDTKGNFTGLIHTEFNFCENSNLAMPFDENVKGHLSATKTLEELFVWFPKIDIIALSIFGYKAIAYEATDYKFYNNHWLINKESSVKLKCISL